MTAPDLIRDLSAWYETLDRPTALRHTLIGDLWHLLIGYAHLRPTPNPQSQ